MNRQDETSAFKALLDSLAAAAIAGDGGRLAALFTEDGVYHDTIYGAFAGQAAIRDMLEAYFHRDASDFRWDFFDPVRSGNIGYARYAFSFTSTIAEFAGRRVAFAGTSRLVMSGARIRHYSEAIDYGVALAQLGVAPERMARIFARRAALQNAGAEFARHVTA